MMTQRQRDVLRFVDDYIRERGVSPLYDDIGDALGICRANVHYLIGRLEERGFIRRLHHQARTMEVVRPKPRGRRIAHNLRLTDFPIEPALEAMTSIDALKQSRAA